MKKGFTLIELLAVIVILAIIALIATPIIINIIENARGESEKRSVELYASAVKNAMASYQLTHPNEPTSVEQLDIDYDGDVECTTTEIYEDGNIYLADCTVNGSKVEGYTYGTEQVITPTTTTIYRWGTETITIGDTVDPTAYTTDASTLNKSYYLKHVLDIDNKVIESWACAIYNGKETCTRGGSPEFYGYAENASDYTGNVLILKGLESEGFSCDFDKYESTCSGSTFLYADSDGGTSSNAGDNSCSASYDGSSKCLLRF